MIQAVIFDLDGTLVQTEILKAISYARTVVQLRPNKITEGSVIDAFKEVVGGSRQEVAEYLLNRFDLIEIVNRQMAELEGFAPWQKFVQIRLKIYNQLLETPSILKKHLCPFNVGLLQYVRNLGLKTGLATMSHCQQAQKVLTILNLQDQFDFIATRDDVENGKPDPEIYLLMAKELAVEPQACLVIEDSLTGIKAALSAGMHCIAVTTDFTREMVHRSGVLNEQWIVDDPRDLLEVARRILGGDSHISSGANT